MHGASFESTWHRYASWAVCYLAWIALSIGAFWSLIQARGVLLTLAVLTGVPGKLISTVDRFGLVLVGLMCIGLVGAMESYLRSGLQAGKLQHRIVRVAAVEAGILAFCYAVQWVLQAIAT